MTYFLPAESVHIIAVMIRDSCTDDGYGADRNVMRCPDIEAESLQYERGVRPPIASKPAGKTRFPGE